MDARWDAAKTVWGAVLGPVVKGTLPYNDLRQRRQVRRETRRLITCEPWRGNDATPIQLAQLALARSLALQTNTRRAVRHGEAVALLARSALETCFVGLYCLYGDDPLTAMRGGNAKALRRMLVNLGHEDIITEDVLKAIEADIGGDGKLPDARKMAESISAGLNDAPFPLNLYWRVYVPLSEFFAHANGMSLMRHVGDKGVLLEKAAYPWARWSAVHTADGCVGLLAAAIAHKDGHPNELFGSYADHHLLRSLAPLAVVSGKGMFRSLGPRRLLALVKGVVDLRAYKASGRAEADSFDDRVAYLRSWFERHVGNFDDISEEIWDIYVERVVTVLATNEPASDPPSPGTSA
ncbi:MAG: hypothetical protein JWM85_3219 [Acidimicrobiaceae bacterium]|nr:hypothetical protein [Acidimicrobiaceae bacterium]